MKGLILVLAAGSLWAQAPARPKAAPSKPAAAGPAWKQLKFPPPAPAKLPAIERHVLSNGMRVYLLENHELPLIEGTAMIRTGNLFDPPDQVGLAAMTGIVMRSGGTRTLTGEQVDERIEAAGATVDVTIGETAGVARFSTLTAKSQPVLEIFRDILAEPEFRDAQVAAARTRLRGSIARRNIDPAAIAEREFISQVYGRQTPYGWQMDYRHLLKIRRAGLVEFHRRYFFPANVMLAVYGDFQVAEMKDRLEKLFGGWKTAQPPVPEFPAVAAKPVPQVLFADRPKTPFTYFQIGHLGGQRNDKDYAALQVAASVLGSGYTGRIVYKLRGEMNWAEEVTSDWSAQPSHPGLFRVFGTAKSTSTADSFAVIDEEIRKLATGDVSENELRTARESVLRRFAHEFDTPQKALGQFLLYEYFGFPADFVAKHQAALSAVTRADVRRVAAQFFKPDQLTFVAVADARDFIRPLSILNRPVEKIDLTIPELSAEDVKPTAETIAAGKALLERMRQGLGGTEKLAAIRDWAEESEFRLAPSAGGITISQTARWLAPSHFRQTVVLPAGRIESYCDGEKGWMVTTRSDGPLLGDPLRQAKNEIFRSYVWLFMSDRDPAKTVHSPEENVVEILGADGLVARISWDAAAGLPGGVSLDSPRESVQEEWADFAAEAGVLFPRKITILRGGAPYANVTVKSIKVNSGETVETLGRRPSR